MADKERERRTTLTVVIGDGLLLLCALWGLTGSFLSLYGGQEWGALMPFRFTPLDVCAGQMGYFILLAAVFAMLVLAVWSLPRFGWAAAGGAAVLFALALFVKWEDVVRGAGLTVHVISLLFAQRVEWGEVFPFDTALYPYMDEAAVRVFLTLALAGLALLLGWAVVRARRWWLVLALTLPPLLPGLLADLYPSWPAFMALAACWCVMILTSLCKWAAPNGRGRLTLIVFPAVALALAFITLAYPREGYARPPWARKAEEDLMNLTSHASDFFSQWDGPFKQTVTYVGSAEEADLTDAGPLNYSGRTVLRVTSDYDGRLYLRGSSLAGYEDGVWKAMPEGTYQEYLDSLGGQEDTVSPLVFPTWLNRHEPSSTVTVENVGAVGGCVYAPYYLIDQDWDELGMLPVEDAYFARRQGQWSHTMEFCPPETVLFFDHDSDELAAYQEYVYDHYLDVPEETRETLEQFFVGSYRPDDSLSPFGTALDIADLLDSLCEYDINAPAAPEGVDPVDYFLNESRRGYCMHYASAATLMLRAMGIPARYVSGFTAVSVPNKQVDVPDRAAHAWVEVWVSGFGWWYPVEVTPAAAFEYETAQGGEQIDLPSEGPTEAPGESATPQPTEAPTPSESVPGGVGDAPNAEGDISAPFVLPGWVKWLFWAVVGVALVWLVQFGAKRFRTKRMAGPDANQSALACYGYLSRLERWSGRIDGRALELAEKARFSQHTLTEEELDYLRRQVDRERTRLCVTSSLPKRLVFRYLWGLPRPLMSLKTEEE